MPKLNSAGDIIYGVSGGVGVFTNDGTHHPIEDNANNGGWLDNNTVIYQRLQPTQTIMRAHFNGANKIPLKGYGANVIFANHFDYASWMWGNDVGGGLIVYGLIRQSNQIINGAGLGSIGKDGTLVYVADYLGGKNMMVGSTLYQVPAIFSTSTIDINRAAGFTGTNELAFVENGVLVHKILANATIAGKIFDVDGQTYICHNSQHHAIVYNLADPTRGWTFGAPDHAYNPDAIWMGDNVKVCWSYNAGELRNESEWKVNSLSTPMQPFDGSEFKQMIINKLPMQLNQQEIDYLIELVRRDM